MSIERINGRHGFIYTDTDDDQVLVIRRDDPTKPFTVRTSHDGAYLTPEQAEHLVAFLTRPCTCTVPADCPAHGTEASG